MHPADLSPAPPLSPDDGDASLIRWMLSLSPEERLAVLQGFVDSAVELRNDRAVLGILRQTLRESGEK